MLSIKDLECIPFFIDKKLGKINLLPNQGLCNKNYLLHTSACIYVLRKFNMSMNINRKNEFIYQNLAHKNNLAAKAHCLSKNKDLMVCDFLPGEHKVLLSSLDQKALVIALQTLHIIPLNEKAINLDAEYQSYNKDCISPTLTSKLSQYFSDIKNFETDYVFCHNDLNIGNILFEKTVKFIDWEYSCFNDRYFDLANIIIEFNFTKEEESSFLKRYFNKNVKCNFEKIFLFKIVYLALSLLWFDAHAQTQKRDLFFEKLEKSFK